MGQKKKQPIKRTARTRPKRQKPESLRLRAVQPSLTVNDLDTSIRFYQDVLGFVVTDEWRSEGEVVGVSMRAGLVDLFLGQDDFQKGRDRRKGEGCRLYCHTVQDVDAIAVRIRAAGATLTQEPRDRPWGVRELALTDPDGFKLTIYAKRS